METASALQHIAFQFEEFAAFNEEPVAGLL